MIEIALVLERELGEIIISHREYLYSLSFLS